LCNLAESATIGAFRYHHDDEPLRMSSATLTSRLDRAIDDSHDHILGLPDAELTLAEYGSYACPYCRAANDEIAAVRDRYGESLRYVFRHRPLTGSDLARRAAELAERAADQEEFWRAHIALMTRSETLTEDDLRAVAADLGIDYENPDADKEAAERTRLRVDADEASARASGVKVTPTFFINGRRYDGPWDSVSLSDALLGRLGHRVSAAALDFASWGPSAGFLLFLATLLALAVANSPLGAEFEAFWETPLGISFGTGAFTLSLRHWINDGLLTIFFLVVGLEIKREFTVGHLASRKAAALPIAAAIGGMVVPTLIYLLIIPPSPWAHGWGVPMATDTAFAIALIVALGDRVPVALRIFLTAAAIVDDIGAILVVALFYSGDLNPGFLAIAALFIVGLACRSPALRRSGHRACRRRKFRRTGRRVSCFESSAPAPHRPPGRAGGDDVPLSDRPHQGFAQCRTAWLYGDRHAARRPQRRLKRRHIP
jgi:NhaA family Na+:H+ antiporter